MSEKQYVRRVCSGWKFSVIVAISALIIVPLSLLILLFLAMSGTAGVIFTTTKSIMFGWVSYMWRVFPEAEWDTGMILTGFSILTFAVLGFHFLARTFRRHWRWRWTGGWVASGFFLFFAAIATTGIVHQTKWLLSEDFVVSSRSFSKTRELADLRSFTIALKAYRIDHGNYPGDLHDLYPDYIDVDPAANLEFWTYNTQPNEFLNFLYLPEVGDIEPNDYLGWQTDSRIVIATPYVGSSRVIVGTPESAVRHVLVEKYREGIAKQSEDILERKLVGNP